MTFFSFNEYSLKSFFSASKRILSGDFTVMHLRNSHAKMAAKQESPAAACLGMGEGASSPPPTMANLVSLSLET